MSAAMRLENGVAVVSGGGSGVGRAVAQALAEAGAVVGIIGRRETVLADVAEAWAGRGALVPLPADVRDAAGLERTLGPFLQEHGTPRLLCAAHGVHGEFTPILESDAKRWEQTVSINLTGTYHLCRLIAPMMVGSWGRIVLVSSAASLAEPAGMNSAYPLSKYALNYFGRQLAEELRPTPVTVNMIHPGEVKTEMWQAIRSDAAVHNVAGAKEWAAIVERTGGDLREKSAHLVLDLCDERHDATTGRFLWIQDGIQAPRPTW